MKRKKKRVIIFSERNGIAITLGRRQKYIAWVLNVQSMALINELQHFSPVADLCTGLCASKSLQNCDSVVLGLNLGPLTTYVPR